MACQVPCRTRPSPPERTAPKLKWTVSLGSRKRIEQRRILVTFIFKLPTTCRYCEQPGLPATHLQNSNMTSIEHSPLSAAQADALLDLLSTDDNFRSLFSTDPRQALADIGYIVPEHDQPACLKIESLASKEEFQQSRGALKQHLTSVEGLTVVFCYEAGKTGSATAD
jgi:putative modified peptide